MTSHAGGTFEVKLAPQATDDEGDGAAMGRMSIDKQFRGDLEGESKGEMLTAMTAVKGSAGYVALERVSGTLQGRRGTFVLQHTGTMARGAAQLAITVVPDSGTGPLAGLAGEMKITIEDGKHSYAFEYTLAPSPSPSPSWRRGRPEPGEYADYAQADIDLVEGDDILPTLAAQAEETLGLLRPVDEGHASTFAYAPGKWTLKQVVGHLSDDERIFAYRALCVARNDARPLPGFEEKDYVRFAGFEERSWSDLLEEFRIVRECTLAFIRGLTAEAWLRRGIVNGYDASVRGLVFHVAGHERHHLRMVREKYLTGPAPGK